MTTPAKPPRRRRARVTLYARNSKPPKGWRPSFPGEEPPGSWKVQLEMLRDRASREDVDIVLEEHDADVSGRDPNRPAWKRVLAAARGHHTDEIWATRLDRVMRGVVHYHRTAEEFTKLGVDLVFVEQGLRISQRGALSKFIIGQLALAAELELDLARDRSDEVMELRDDGRTYGPRSERPAGRPREYGPEHKFRRRGDHLVHDAARCPACRGEKGGLDREGREAAETGGSPEGG